MKDLKAKVFNAMMKAIPVCAALAVFINVNSVASPMNGQPVPPSGLEKYRKF